MAGHESVWYEPVISKMSFDLWSQFSFFFFFFGREMLIFLLSKIWGSLPVHVHINYLLILKLMSLVPTITFNDTFFFGVEAPPFYVFPQSGHLRG